jgi:amidase
MTIKESYRWSGSPTTFGIVEMKDNIADDDALAVHRLAAAGANVFGKTNVPIRLADFQSYNAIYGTTNNPWDHARTPGGSSGGSAAALAAGMTGLEIGSDIGGSIRNPAHFCGVFGHKPTWGLVPPRGHALDKTLSPTDISVVGPLGRSAWDLELALSQMAGSEAIDAPMTMAAPSDLPGEMKDLRIAVWISDPMCPTSSGVAARAQAVADALGAAGARVEDQSRPDFSAEESHAVFSGLLSAALAARLTDDAFAERIARADRDPLDMGPGAVQARWQTMRYRDWTRLNEARTRLRWAWKRFFDDVDVLITPVMPVTAFPHDHSPENAREILVDARPTPYFSQTFWAGLAGVAYLPATVFPAGLAPDGLPVGLQIIGPAFGDYRTIGVAKRLEAMGFCFQPPPDL